MNKNRQKYNKKILLILSDWIDKYPDERFIQALWNLRLIDWNDDVNDKTIKDRYYEESCETLKRVERKIND